MKSRIVVALSALLVAACPAAAQQFLGPTPYLSAADSPFDGSAMDYFYLEDFLDASLNTPGVSAPGGSPYGGDYCDSVDADDGVIDGSGKTGWSFFNSGAVVFVFDADALGHLPTHAGVVWTDGINPIIFEAFDKSGTSLGSIGGTHADGSSFSETAEDRFYGVIFNCGIGSIKITNAGPTECDHLQYGYDPGSACRPDCNGDCRLNINDFICFQAKWRAREAYGDFDKSGTYTVNDFIRFQAAFVKGCS